MEYADYHQALRTTRPELGSELAGFLGLGGVMGWMQSRNLPLASVEIIQQDEYSLDFVVPLDSAGEHLVFGIT